MNKQLTKIYCCKTCANKVCRDTALYGGGECRSCSRSGEKHFRFKGRPAYKFYGCIDCGSKISYNNYLHGNRRCRSCSKQSSLNSNYGNGKKISGKKNPCYGLRGEAHPSYVNGSTGFQSLIRTSSKGKRWIKDCLIRDNFTCQVCGFKGSLVVHHIKPFSKILNEFIKKVGKRDKNSLVILSQEYKPFWVLDNGISLCKDCHKEVHKKGECK